MLHYLCVGLRITITQSHTHTMQQTRTHKAVTRRVEARKRYSLVEGNRSIEPICCTEGVWISNGAAQCINPFEKHTPSGRFVVNLPQVVYGFQMECPTIYTRPRKKSCVALGDWPSQKINKIMVGKVSNFIQIRCFFWEKLWKMHPNFENWNKNKTKTKKKKTISD